MTAITFLIVTATPIPGMQLEAHILKLGYKVAAVVATANQAIAVATTESPDLVLMEIDPAAEQAGMDTATCLRSKLGIPVIVLIPEESEVGLKQANLAQPCSYLLKPIRDRELQDRVETALHLRRLSEERQTIEAQLQQRIKELECFYAISKLADTPGLSLTEILTGVIDLVARAWQYSEVAHSRILFSNGEEILCTHGKLPINREWSMSVPIRSEGKYVGDLTVFYAEARPAADEGVFLKQERRLLDALSERVGKIITRFRMQKALEASEKRYQTILETAPVGIQISDLKGVITYINQAHQKIHGTTKDQIIGRYIWGFNSTEEESLVEQKNYFDAIRNETEHAPFHYHDATLNGKIIDVVVNRCNLYDENQHVNAVCSFITDITESRETQLAYQESEEKYRTLFNVESDALVLIEIDTGNVLETNKAFLELYGYSREEVLSMKNTDFSAEPEATVAATQGLKTAVPIRWHKKKDGTVFPVEIVANIFEYKGKKAHIAAIRDISERIRTEAQIKAALKEKEILLQEVHHRVKNNLAVVASLLDLQRNKTKDENVKRILRDSRNRLHTMSLVHEFLYRSENLSEIDMKQYLTNLVHMIRQSFGKVGKGIEVELLLKEQTISLEKATAVGLVVNELITNSLKYAFPKTNRGKLKIECSDDEHDRMTLTVEDNGIGLPAGFNWETTDTLGLNLVKTLVENQLDGSVSLAGEPGTRFVITFSRIGVEK